MKPIFAKFIFLILAIALDGTECALAAKQLYRYTDASGIPVVNDRLPPEAIKNGYEVLNGQGVVVSEVPAQMTPEQVVESDEQAAKERAAREAKALQAQKDQLLLMRYSSISDIEAARERALQSIRIRVSILRSNIRSMVQQVENYQAEAANIERAGGTVDGERIDAINSLRKRLASTQRQLSDRELEMQQVRADYQVDIDRFQHLLDQVELRRKMSNPASADEAL
jgi:hypothetical protein